MLVTTHYATLENGLATPRFYENEAKGEPTFAATFFKDAPEYLSPNFEGPPATFRTYSVEVVSFVGKVVATKWENTRVMSDVWEDVLYVTVFVGGEEGFKTFGTGGKATVDATPELLAKHAEHVKLETEFAEVRARARAVRRAAKDAALEAATPRKGKTIKVVKGRKVPKGTVGECIWYGEGAKYSYYGSVPMRVGPKTSDGTVFWTAASNVEVVTATA